MEKFTASSFYTHSEGLNIFNGKGDIVVIVKGDSTKEVAARAKKILDMLNEDYYNKQALLEDNQWNYDRGIVTTAEYEARKVEITA